jgi:cell wall-associated NlpC family hydrolase
MTHTFQVEGLTLQTGDILCTMNGKPDILPGEFWRLVGRLVPGDVDHVALYVGPGGRAVEAGSRGVITFELPGGGWDTERMARQRGHLFDTLYGVASPLDGLGLSEEDEAEMRAAVADYALAQVGKPYNLNFLNAEAEDAFYCSQLVYKAYQRVGINLNTGLSIEHFPGTNAIVYPQEIWAGSAHRSAQMPSPRAEPK